MRRIEVYNTFLSGRQRRRRSHRPGDSGGGHGGLGGVRPDTGQDPPVQGDHARCVRRLRRRHGHLHLHARLRSHRCGLLEQYSPWVRFLI